MQSGRCWMFATLNTLRFHIEKKLELPHGTFELSQNYLTFYNKLERANWFLNQMIETAQDPIESRKVHWLFMYAMADGGDFPEMVDLVKKYGIVPHDAMPETYCSDNTAELNTVLNKVLRQAGMKIRDMVADKASDEALKEYVHQTLSEVYRILEVCLGNLPEKFDFEYTDTKGQYHGDFGLTPETFTEKYLPINLEDYVGLCNIPAVYVPYGTPFGIECANEIRGQAPLRYLNASIDDLKAITIAQLKDNEPVWFGSDVLQSSDRFNGTMEIGLFDYENMFDVKFTDDKDRRYLSQESLPTHAMTIAGVDIHDNKPIRWKVENSWGASVHGQKVGHNGYFIMGDKWFDNYVYEVAVRKDLLPQHLQDALKKEPVILPFWNTFNPVDA